MMVGAAKPVIEKGFKFPKLSRACRSAPQSSPPCRSRTHRVSAWFGAGR